MVARDMPQGDRGWNHRTSAEATDSMTRATGRMMRAGECAVRPGFMIRPGTTDGRAPAGASGRVRRNRGSRNVEHFVKQTSPWRLRGTSRETVMDGRRACLGRLLALAGVGARGLTGGGAWQVVSAGGFAKGLAAAIPGLASGTGRRGGGAAGGCPAGTPGALEGSAGAGHRICCRLVCRAGHSAAHPARPSDADRVRRAGCVRCTRLAR